MENPYEVLGIEELSQEEKIAYLETIQKDLDKRFSAIDEFIKKNSIVKSSRYHSADDVVSMLNERVVLGLPIDDIYMNEEDYEVILQDKANQIREDYVRVFGKWKEDRTNEEASSEMKEINQRKYYLGSCIYAQRTKLQDRVQIIARAIKANRESPENPDAIEMLNDVFYGQKYKEAVLGVAQKMPIDQDYYGTCEPNDVFKAQLEQNPEYIHLKQAYNKIWCASARADLDAEKFVLKRIGGTLPKKVSEQEVNKLLIEEIGFADKYWDSILKEWSGKAKKQHKVAGNQNHRYGWGIVLTDPESVISAGNVATPDFEGTITVNKLGYFSGQNWYKKKENKLSLHNLHSATINEVLEKNGIKADEGYEAELLLDRAESTDIRMRGYAYRHEAQRTAYNNIYEVRKTDKKGRERVDIVISPVSEKTIKDEKNYNYMKEVFFSDYMLDSYKENGGFTGTVVKDKYGKLGISNICFEDQQRSAILFSNGTHGQIYDCRGKKFRDDLEDDRYYDRATIKDFYKVLKEGREKTRNE